MKKIIISCLLTAVVMTIGFVLGAGYFIGNYLVSFGLERGTYGGHTEPPRAFALLMPPESRQYDRPDYLSEPWEMQSGDGLHLTATHFSPQVTSNKWVIVAHGYGCNQTNSYYIAENYLMMGYHVLTPDLRASGESEGKFLTMGLYESNDVTRWAGKIAMHYPEARIVLHGVSMGAATVMMAQDFPLPSNVKGIIDDCGFSDTWEEVRQFGRIYHIHPSCLLMPVLNLFCRLRIGIDLHEASPKKALKTARLPILMIHGTADKLVPIRNSFENYAACRAPKRLVEVEGADHIQSYFTDPELYEREVLAFFERCGI